MGQREGKLTLEVLREKGGPEDDLKELGAAVTEDGEASDVTVDKEKTQTWLLKTAAKAGKGAMKIGTKAFTEVAIAAIEHYAKLSWHSLQDSDQNVRCQIRSTRHVNIFVHFRHPMPVLGLTWVTVDQKSLQSRQSYMEQYEG